MRSPRSARRGGGMVEFAVVLFLLLSVIMAGIEFDRMVLVYNSVANAAAVGVRYAIVHGGDRTGTGDAGSGATDSSAVVGVVKGWAKIGFLDPDKLTITVTYPASTNVKTDPGNAPGSAVNVAVSYPYDPLTFVRLPVTLRASSRGVIVF